MPMTLQVLYPVGDGITFDHDYYVNTHLPMVGEHMGAHLSGASASKGLAGGPDTPSGFHVIATLTFADQAALNAGMAKAGPVVADIANFYTGAAQMMIGETVA